MEVILHDTISQEAYDERARTAAIVHADLIANYINQLPYTIDQKRALIQTICELSQAALGTDL